MWFWCSFVTGHRVHGNAGLVRCHKGTDIETQGHTPNSYLWLSCHVNVCPLICWCHWVLSECEGRRHGEVSEEPHESESGESVDEVLAFDSLQLDPGIFETASNASLRVVPGVASGSSGQQQEQAKNPSHRMVDHPALPDGCWIIENEEEQWVKAFMPRASGKSAWERYRTYKGARSRKQAVDGVVTAIWQLSEQCKMNARARVWNVHFVRTFVFAH